MPCVFNVLARTSEQIAMKAGFKNDLTRGFTLEPSLENVPHLMENHTLVTAVYRDGYRRRDHLVKIVGMSIDVDHRDKGRATSEDEAAEVIKALGSPECFWTISSRGGLHMVTWLPSCLEGKPANQINSFLDTVRFILETYKLPDGWYIDGNAKGASRSLFPGGHAGHYYEGVAADKWYEDVKLKEGQRNSSIFQSAVKSAKSGNTKTVEIALNAGAKSGLDVPELTAIARSAASYAVKDDPCSVADRVVELLRPKFFYSTLDGCFYMSLETGIWQKCSGEIFKQNITAAVRQLGVSVTLNTLTRSIPSYVKSALAVDNYRWPSQAGEMPLENGVLYRDSNGTWKLRSYLQSDRFLGKYSVSITADEINSFASPSKTALDLLDGFTSDKQAASNLLALVKCCLLGDNHDQRFAIIYGPAKTGKSLFMKLLKEVMGGNYFYILQSTSMGNNRFGLDRRLEGPRVVSIPELSNEKMPRDKIINLASTDRISLESKGKDSSEVRLTGVPIATTNTVPRFPFDDSGVMARLLFIPFNREHEGRGTEKEEREIIESSKRGLCIWALARGGAYRDGEDKKTFADFNNEALDAILAYYDLSEGCRVPLVQVYECLRNHGVVTSKQAVSKAIEAAGMKGLYIEAKRGRAREVVGIKAK